MRMLRKVLPRTMPVMAGYLFLGIAFGVAMKAKGFALGWSALLSAIVYGGSLQFAMIEPLTQAFAPLTIAALSLLVQARHIFYGLSMLEAYRPTGRCKPYLVFALTDETYSLVCHERPRREDAARWYTCISVLDHAYWIIGTVLGGLLGAVIPTEALAGIDFSMTALFVVIVTEQSMDSFAAVKAGRMSVTESLFAPLTGGIATLFSLLTAGKGSFLLLSMALILASFGLRWQASERRCFTA